MDTALNILNVVMALALWWKRGCRWFALIQTLQLFEISSMTSAGFPQWICIDQANIAVEGIAVISTSELKWSRVLMLAHALLKCYRYSLIDCTYELTRGTLYWSIWSLNIAILFTLLVYAFSMPMLRLKEQYARRSNRPDYPAEATPAAAI